MLILEQEGYPICELRLRCNALQSEELNQPFREKDKLNYDVIAHLSEQLIALTARMSIAVDQSINRQDKSSL
jgi:hypothetical protein